MTKVPEAFERAQRRYFDATPKSRALYERARGILPNGIGRAGIPFLHYPLSIERAEGQFLYDVDGRALLDLWNGASSLPLGHAHPAVMAATRAQLDKGLGFGLPAAPEIELAELLRERLPSMELIRFTASGTEATMYAVRLARAYTGRQLMARMGRSYHGTHDMMLTGQGASLGGTWLGLDDHPVGAGVLPTVRDGVIFLPFNDLAGCERAVEARAGEIATIIVEPFMGTGGGVVADAGFLRGLRALCDRHGILLTFDEMISIGMAKGGAQAHYGVTPDLTASGKMVTGGMPGGVFGGRADVMALLEPVNGVPPVLHTGTWSGHPLAMAAGLAQLRALDDAAFHYLAHIGEHYRSSVRALAARMGLAVQVTGVAHFSALHFTDRAVRRPEDAFGDAAVARRMHFSMLSQGFNMFGGRTNLSTAITEADIARSIGALEIAFEEAGAPAMA